MIGKRIPQTALALLGASMALGGPGESRRDDFEAAFVRLKGLVGTWTIATASVRAEPYQDHRTVVYTLTGNGSALVERFRGEPSMTSVYHMDGRDLRLTHYCNAGNQPRMKAASYDPERSALQFGFVDVTDLAARSAYHTRELEIVFQDADRVQLRFNGRKQGADVPAVMTLERLR